MADNSDIKTPWHLWVVGILLLLWQGLASFDYMATVLKYEPYLSQFPEEALAYYYSSPMWMFALWAIASLGGLLGAILLLLRNKLAAPLFAIAFIAGLIASIYMLLNPGPEGTGGFMAVAFANLFGLAIVIYVFWQKRRGVLR
jgi:hypothetical protein